ncbi:MAG: hypothetical protein ACHQD9_08055 [Chitinophagales bacterium]
MIIQRNTFRLKFGKAREALAVWKEIIEQLNKDGRFKPQTRLLTDLTGEAYILVLEMNIKSFTEMNPLNHFWAINQPVRELYHQKFVPLCESASQELYKIEFES